MQFFEYFNAILMQFFKKIMRKHKKRQETIKN